MMTCLRSLDHRDLKRKNSREEEDKTKTKLPQAFVIVSGALLSPFIVFRLPIFTLSCDCVHSVQVVQEEHKQASPPRTDNS